MSYQYFAYAHAATITHRISLQRGSMLSLYFGGLPHHRVFG